MNRLASNVAILASPASTKLFCDDTSSCHDGALKITRETGPLAAAIMESLTKRGTTQLRFEDIAYFLNFSCLFRTCIITPNAGRLKTEDVASTITCYFWARLLCLKRNHSWLKAQLAVFGRALRPSLCYSPQEYFTLANIRSGNYSTSIMAVNKDFWKHRCFSFLSVLLICRSVLVC